MCNRKSSACSCSQLWFIFKAKTKQLFLRLVQNLYVFLQITVMCAANTNIMFTFPLLDRIKVFQGIKEIQVLPRAVLMD